ncbi:protease inhibitor Inh/omp19 family protein [Pseudomonas syringae pv. tagetis]|uniref:Protease inhibitor Inh n=3 Tax=Pseudomonas syringae group TaxID=136849 RepID=A0A0Q0AVW6_9PSED|nr:MULTISPECIES: protease inhibitor Inh/omp19 family protein [Pseudomonas syringae group]KPX42379.1 Protease inhibitor Inh [Pseudomonas syringae pv. helianthi]KPY83108.1 Protease inhibitor Inh [Pseudomonas syringae pv. tagetis]RMR08928.1 Protease inhibitor Inh [Pseudomonas syringae pv. helianthi]RMV09869.1 Protease inhibitor Inh [Pseudomonas savastanoi]RMW10605.1 Protease inhibitor Inh [Pseudomonas syringae pv. tagetis]
MKPNRFFQYSLAAFALLTSISGVSMAMSLKLPSPAELSGKWQLFVQAQADQACELQLNTDMPQLGGDSACAAKWLHEAPVGWFPTPDGLALTGKEGNRLIHFNHMGEQHYQARLPDGKVLMLERVDQ